MGRPMGADSEFMKTAGVSAFLGISEETVRHWHKVDSGPASVRVGRHRLYRRTDVEAWLDGLREAEKAARSA